MMDMGTEAELYAMLNKIEGRQMHASHDKGCLLSLSAREGVARSPLCSHAADHGVYRRADAASNDGVRVCSMSGKVPCYGASTADRWGVYHRTSKRE
jgi:hypothetical protein